MLPMCTGTESGTGHWEPTLASVQGKYLLMLPIGTGTESGAGHWEPILASVMYRVSICLCCLCALAQSQGLDTGN
jgi:hypothetical protein